MGQATSTIFRCISSCCGGGGDDTKQKHHPGLGEILLFQEEIRQNKKTFHPLGNPLVLHPTIPTPQQPCKDLAVRQGLVVYSPKFITDHPSTTDGSPDLLSLDMNEDSDDEEEKEVVYSPKFITDPSTDGAPDLISFDMNEDSDDEEEEEVVYSPKFITDPSTDGSPDLISFDMNEDSDEEEEEEEEEVVIWEVRELQTGVWICHYCSSQRILLVGEGDFSFSASLAAAFGTAYNITATSLDSQGFLRSNYKNAAHNISRLENRGATVMHGIDATEMADYPSFECRNFDRIIYNFPHSGFFGKEPRQSQLFRHRKLVRLFMRNAKKMIWGGGEVHITHKSNNFFLEWNLKLLASMEGLRFIEEVHFNFREYPGYRTKYGFGGDRNFNCNPSKTYKFGL